jgi:hypothetical protein
MYMYDPRNVFVILSSHTEYLSVVFWFVHRCGPCKMIAPLVRFFSFVVLLVVMSLDSQGM